MTWYEAMLAGDYEYETVVYNTVRGMRIPTIETVTVDVVDEETSLVPKRYGTREGKI